MNYFDRLPDEIKNYIYEFRGFDDRAIYIKKVLKDSIDHEKIDEIFEKENLNDREKEIVLTHLNHSLLHYIIFRFQSHIIDEFHEKKCTFKKKYFKGNKKDDDKFYKKYLFFNKKGFTSWSPMNSLLKSLGDGYLYELFNGKRDKNIFFDIYYSNYDQNFLKKDWEKNIPSVLSNETKLNNFDKMEIKNVYYWYKFSYESMKNYIPLISLYSINYKNDYYKMLKKLNKLINE